MPSIKQALDQNLTAAVHAITHMLPMQQRLTTADSILSFFSPLEPAGLSIALSAAYSGSLTIRPFAEANLTFKPVNRRSIETVTNKT